MGKKIRLKRKSTIAVLSILACLVGLASWMAAFYHTNHLPYQSLTKFIRRVILFQLATTILFLRMRTLTVIVCKSMMQNC